MKPIRIEIPNALQVAPVNAYLFIEPEPVLVDTGPKSDSDWAALQAGLAAHGLTVADLSRVIITHPHVDHFGQAAPIAAHSRAEIWVSELGRGWLTDPAATWAKRIAYYEDYFLPKTGMEASAAEMILRYMRMTAATCDPIPAARLVTFPVDGAVEMGGRDWQVLHMPGHASHQTSFYQPETRRFLAGDMLLQKTPTPVVERPSSGKKHVPGLPQFLDSLDRVEVLEIDMVYPGHGEPFQDYVAVVQRQRERILQRKEECLACMREGCDTAVSLVDHMYSNRHAAIQFAGLWMVIGYLDLLQADGLIVVEEVDGVLHYLPSSPAK
ncbi:MAG: MBL fold metallo-hydrolase [Chloroflexi bacterium]|nr:MBL fold metallo-hydrolase [Chloroflexota bacterium]